MSLDIKFTDEKINRILQNDQRRSKKKEMYLLIITLIVLVSSVSMSLSLLLSYDDDESYFNKDVSKKLILAAVKNGASLDNIKHIYNTRVLYTKPIFVKKDNFTNENYTANTSLSFILKDMLLDYYIPKDFKVDSLYLCSLKDIIKENEETNPFDKLEENQRYSFENIRLKTDSNYIKIQSDIIRITEELDSKNQLVNKYLNKSEISFNLSILAIIITSLLSVYQIYQNYSSAKNLQKVIADILEKSKDDKQINN